MKLPFKISRYIVLFLVCIGLIAIASDIFSDRVYEKTEEEISLLMQDSAQKINLGIQVQFEQSRALLHGLAELCAHEGMENQGPAMLNLLQTVQNESQISIIAMATPDGRLYNVAQDMLDVSGGRWLEKVMQGEDAYYIGNLDFIEDVEWAMIIAVPVVQEDEVVAAIIGVIRAEQFEKMMNTGLFGDIHYSYLLTDKGEVLAAKSGTFRPTLYEVAQEFDDFTPEAVDEMLASMAGQETTFTHYRMNGESYHFLCTPAYWNGWYYISALPDNAISSQTFDSVTNSLIFAAFAGGLVLLAFVAVLHALWKSYRVLGSAFNEIDSTYNAIPIAVFQFYLNPTLSIRRANDAFYRLIGCTQQEYSETYKDSIAPLMSPPDIAALEEYSEGIVRREFWIRCHDGTVKWVYGAFDLIRKEEHALLQCTLTNTTVQKQELEEYKEFALRDAMTGLRNRTALYEILSKHLATMEKPVGMLMMFDLDNFRRVNDTLGHPAGDRLLRQIAKLFQDCFEEGDQIGRLGGDEFAVILTTCRTKEEATHKVRKLFEQFAENLEEDFAKCGVAISAGGALIRANDAVETVYDRADRALYTSKRRGKGRYCFYEDL